MGMTGKKTDPRDLPFSIKNTAAVEAAMEKARRRKIFVGRRLRVFAGSRARLGRIVNCAIPAPKKSPPRKTHNWGWLRRNTL
jgi:hypothetical protein